MLNLFTLVSIIMRFLVYFKEYLPYHYLLASIGKEGSLKYHDISTGAIIAGLLNNFLKIHSS